jgi:hypothetical protein
LKNKYYFQSPYNTKKNVDGQKDIEQLLLKEQKLKGIC